MFPPPIAATPHTKFDEFPAENAYQQYLTSHSGYSNAYTAATETNYFFEVAASAESQPANGTSGERHGILKNAGPESPDDHSYARSPLHGALERFAPFFICPLFLAGSLDRELRAVDSENKKNLQSDHWRLVQLDKSLSNSQHPYHHFSTGNLQTLRDEPRKRGVEIRKEFIAFHDRHYSANRMKLVVLGKEPLDVLEGWVADFFAGVENKDLAPIRWPGVQPYSEDNLLTQIFAKPVMDNRSLDIFFLYKDEEHLYRSQPSRYLSHLIGHEGPGSILSYLKAKGWANGLSAGAMTVCHGSGLFEISIRLTKGGLENYKEVAKIVFQYISMLKKTVPQKWIFDETKGMSEVDFRFKQKAPASSFTSRLSSVMQKPLPREWLLSGERVLRDFDQDAISEALSYLRADNYRLTLVSQGFPGDWDKTEKWYGTHYRAEKIPEDFQAALRQAIHSTASDRPEELHLPHPNEFIPTRLSVEKREVEEPTKTPRLIRNDSGVRLWWKKDDRFWVPKATFKVLLRSPLVMITPENCATANLYCWLVKDALDEYSYDAEIAGLEYNLVHSSLGLGIEVHGYNDKMPVLLEKLLRCMREFEIQPDRFQIVKERLLRGHRNHEFMVPYQQVPEYTRWLGSERTWINEDLLAEVPHITLEDVSAFYPRILNQTHIEALAHGNVHKEDARRMTNLVESILKPRILPAVQWPVRRTLILPEGSDFIYRRPLGDPANVNNCIEYYIQVDTVADELLRAKVQLLGQLGDEKAFNQLRTKEQLGYVVFTGSRTAVTGVGYRIIIQSERSAEYLEERINAFLLQLGQSIEQMPAAEFEGHRRSLIAKRLERLKNLNEEVMRFWTHISTEYFSFQQANIDAENLRTISQKDMVDFFHHYISPTSAHRAKVSVHLVSQASASQAAMDILPEEQREKVLSLIAKNLNTAGVSADHEQLAKRFEDVDIASGDQDAIMEALQSYLTQDAGVPDAQAAAVIEGAAQIMGMALPSLGIELKARAGTGAEELPKAPEMKPSTIIEDVTAFKAALNAGPAPRPTKDLSTYEELEPKL